MTTFLWPVYPIQALGVQAVRPNWPSAADGMMGCAWLVVVLAIGRPEGEPPGRVLLNTPMAMS